jgi:HlyD family secretion protein
MKKQAWLWIGLGALLVVVIIAAGVAKSSQSKIEAVQLAHVRREEVTSRVRAPGKIEPKTQVKISADIMGKVVRLLIKEGDRVKRGQLMLQLDDTQYRSLWEQTRSASAAARTRVRETKTTLRVAESNYARQKALFEQKLLSQAEWDQAESAHESARVAADNAAEDAARAEAAQRGAEDNLRKCQFLAPFDGVVSALNVEQGEIVITGTMNNPGTEIMVVSDLSRMQVRADVDETDVVDMRIGQKAKISVDAIPDTTFDGTVTEIGNTAKRSITSTIEGQTNFEVVVVFDHDVPAVRPGMTADVDIATGTHDNVLVVPIQAVVVRTQRELERAAKGKFHGGGMSTAAAATADEDTVGKKDKEITGVFVVRNKVAEFVPVRTGLSSQTMIEVTGGVKQGEEVVSGPYKALRELKPGGKVRKETGEKKAGK